ncbi:MAG TPA: urease accessory UreF family protein [Verrucomicrobiae bacterium]|nr:urease accessory UreF family protein [Verrucomicrobiae bacterium]
MSATENTWLLWQLADSAFPAGGFAHSGGVEAAWQCGEIRDAAELESFLEASLWQSACSMVPLVRAAHADPGQFPELDHACDSFLSNHVANRASRLQGRALASSAERIFGGKMKIGGACFHLAPVFGVLMRSLAVSANAAVELYFFQSLRAWVAAAVRLGVVGPMEAQSLHYRMAPRAQEILAETSGVPVAEMAGTAPLQEIWQGQQDRLYSRLFQS